jgi:hypothetical protein
MDGKNYFKFENFEYNKNKFWNIDDLYSLSEKVSESFPHEIFLIVTSIKNKIYDLINFSQYSDKSIIVKGNERYKEKYEIKKFSTKLYCETIDSIISNFPTLKMLITYFEIIQLFKFENNEEIYGLNSGCKSKICSSNTSNLEYEIWCNIIELENYEEILLSSHLRVQLNKYTLELENFSFIIKSSNFCLYYLRENKCIKLEIKINTGNCEIFFDYNFQQFSFENNEDKEFKVVFNSLIARKKNSQEISKKISNKFNYKITKIYQKEEIDYDYREKNYEELLVINKFFSHGYKMYENSKKRLYHENWWKNEDPENQILELKIMRNLDDGFGNKTFENLGYKIENTMKVYDFHDITHYDVLKDEYRTFKKGFDKNNKWENSIIDSSHLQCVENYGKKYDTQEEWYETWTNSIINKYCYKKGKNKDKEWEESWSENNSFENIIQDKNCFKKCKYLDNSYRWTERWSENYKENNKVLKNCEKNYEDLVNNIICCHSWHSFN